MEFHLLATVNSREGKQLGAIRMQVWQSEVVRLLAADFMEDPFVFNLLATVNSRQGRQLGAIMVQTWHFKVVRLLAFNFNQLVEQVVADTGFLEVLVEVLGFLAVVRMAMEITQEALLEDLA